MGTDEPRKGASKVEPRRRWRRPYVRVSAIVLPLVALAAILAAFGVIGGRGAPAPLGPHASYPIQSDELANTPFSVGLPISGPFTAVKQGRHACAFIGGTAIFVPSSSGYQVRFNPTVLLDKTGRVIATQGQRVQGSGTPEVTVDSPGRCGARQAAERLSRCGR